jgi:hypothetical protein
MKIDKAVLSFSSHSTWQKTKALIDVRSILYGREVSNKQTSPIYNGRAQSQAGLSFGFCMFAK